MVDSVVNAAFNKVLTDRSLSFKQLLLDVKEREAKIKDDLGAIPDLIRRTNVAMKICEDAVGTIVAPGTGTGTTPQPATGFVPKGVVFEGDSITSGTSENPTPWPTQYGTLTGIRVLNLAVSGSTLNQMNNNYAADDHAGTRYNASTMDTLVIGSAGTNDLALDNKDVASMKGYIQSLSGKGRATGYKVWVTTITLRVQSPSWDQSRENRRIEYNTWLRANFQTFADGLIDMEAALPLSETYDGIHPKDSGALKMAAKARDSFAAAGSAVVPGVVDSITTNGVIDPAKYRSIDLSSAAGIAYRYGTASAPIPNLPTWYKPADKRMPGGDVRTYQLGTYTDEAGDFASNVLHIAFTPDDPNARIGVSDIQATSNSHTVVSLLPELSWVRYGTGLDGTEPDFWRKQGRRVKNPVAMARGQLPGWSVESICIFDDGFICTVGANTMTNKTFCYLGAGKKATGAAVTSSNEFLLVTVWDTINLRGEVAVISLTGLGEGATIANQDPESRLGKDYEGWWGSWREAHPGMHNLGNIAYMKVLGYVPLPGMMAPTEISATTGHHRFRYLNGAGYNETTGNTGNWTKYEDQRQRWAVGDYGDRYARQGIAVIISKTESKAIFLDLKPLFSYMNSMYFGTRENYLKTTNIGDGAGQWPFTFSEVSAQMPVVIKTVDLPSKPTSVLVYPHSYGNTPKRAWIGTEEGQVRIFDLGGYPQNGSPEQIQQVGTVFVGANPTSIGPIKEKAEPKNPAVMPNDIDQSIVVGVRSTKASVFIDFTNNGTTGVIRRTFQDSRIKDLIRVEDHDNHGTVQFTCSIADHLGRCVHNFRYGKIRMETYPNKPEFGMGANGNDQFEYSGAFQTPGHPWWVGTANIS